MGGINAPLALRDLIRASIGSEKPEIAVEAVEALAEYGTYELSQISVQDYSRIQRHLMQSADLSDMRYRFLRTLFENDLYSEDPFETTDRLMVDFAAMAIDRGDTRHTREIIMSLTEPTHIFIVRIDKRFDAVRQDPEVEAFLEMEGAADRYIAKLEGLVNEWPNYALGYVYYSKALVGVWRTEEALDVIEPIALAIRAPNAHQQFMDSKESKNWVLEQYASVLDLVDYVEESEDMYVEAVDVPEVRNLNVNQRLNMANDLIYDGRFDEVLESLATLDRNSTNAFGYMWVQSGMVCAKAMREEPMDYSAHLSYLVAHELDNPPALINALLCVNDEAMAAQHLIQRLRSPDQRVQALLYLHIFDGEEPSHTHTADENVRPGHLISHRATDLRRRADVLRAANQVGRIEEISMHPSIWHKF